MDFLFARELFDCYVAPGGASLAAEERGGAKPRGRGRGRRNINGWRVLIKLLFLKLLFSFLLFIASFVQNPCCAARGHALAVWLRLAPSALAALGLHSAAKCAPRRATFFSAISKSKTKSKTKIFCLLLFCIIYCHKFIFVVIKVQIIFCWHI